MVPIFSFACQTEKKEKYFCNCKFSMISLLSASSSTYARGYNMIFYKQSSLLVTAKSSLSSVMD